jgi:hypothetical protein
LAEQAEAAVGTADGQVAHRAGRRSATPVLAHLVINPEGAVHEDQMGLVNMSERSITEYCDRRQEHHRASGALVGDPVTDNHTRTRVPALWKVAL